MIYAINKEWLSTLNHPPRGQVYVMSEDGVYGATCVIGTLRNEDGEFVAIPEDLEAIQNNFTQGE